MLVRYSTCIPGRTACGIIRSAVRSWIEFIKEARLKKCLLRKHPIFPIRPSESLTYDLVILCMISQSIPGCFVVPPLPHKLSLIFPRFLAPLLCSAILPSMFSVQVLARCKLTDSDVYNGPRSGDSTRRLSQVWKVGALLRITANELWNACRTSA